MLKFLKKKQIIQFILFLGGNISSMVIAGKPIEIPVDPAFLIINTKQNAIFYEVEIAFSETQASAGLMYRTHFPRNRAMLFKNFLGSIPEDKQKMFMWMAHTSLPLDIIFLNSKGVIVSIIENTLPFSKNIISSKVPAAFAIELNAGEVIDKKIQQGQCVIHPIIYEKCESNKS
ncbi:DUF192 domain-containing protein [Bartonella bilalgolemii]|uniref:DUF192 domain-containing protein n=1 Tax=Bartonella bilalgolemii TaxID=2942911 RepID=A0ABT0P9D8_9HYPH|nr:DUF192 domain-containing protein [Bartonella sp. G70]